MVEKVEKVRGAPGVRLGGGLGLLGAEPLEIWERHTKGPA